MPDLAAHALQAKRESKYVEFKERFNPSSAEDWCEIVKDIVAIANSGGGALVIGVKNDGSPSGADVTSTLELDPAVLTDKIKKYTRRDFSAFQIHDADKEGSRIAILVIDEAQPSFVFEEPGTYSTSDGKQKTAFSRGTIYVRHGAKSEPMTNADMFQANERLLELFRKEWIGKVKKVVEAPLGSKISVQDSTVRQTSDPTAAPVRIVNDPTAPAYRLQKPDDYFPHRGKELIARVNGMLDGGIRINTRDLLAVRRVHNIDDNPDFFYKGKFGSPQYSDACADWLVERYRVNPRFFEEARIAFRGDLG